MLFKVYEGQKNNPVNGDWVNSLNKDKEDFGIEMDNDNLIAVDTKEDKIDTKLNVLMKNLETKAA